MTLNEMLDFELIGNPDVSHAVAVNNSTILVTFKDGSLGALGRTDEEGWQWLGGGPIDAAIIMAGGFNA